METLYINISIAFEKINTILKTDVAQFCMFWLRIWNNIYNFKKNNIKKERINLYVKQNYKIIFIILSILSMI